MPRLIKAAILCGALPLVAGTLIYLTWRFTRWDALMLAGMITIGGGLIAFAAGGICLLLQSRRAVAARQRFRAQGLAAFAVLLINFPAAVFFTLSAIDVKTRYTVRVHNETAQAIESLVVIGPGISVELGPIPARPTVSAIFHHRGKKKLEMPASIG